MLGPKIGRPVRLREIELGFARAPVVALLVPRQCGKTTLAGMFRGEGDAAWFDLERSTDRQALAVAAEATLAPLQGLVVLDEIQEMPELFPVLRVLADREPGPARFLILGSASPDLVRGAAETLAGRVAFVHLSGFDLEETGSDEAHRLWQRGGLPRSFLATDDAESFAWRQDFIETFLSRDASRFGIAMPPEQLRRFWTMLAHCHGGVLNVASVARAHGIDQKTASRYVDILTGALLVRRLPPWFDNVGKRQVKSPKIYLRDSGLLHALLGLRNPTEVRTHPRFGLSWEGFALEQVITLCRAEREASYWATHGGAELDLLLVRGGKRYGFEFKFSDAPKTTKSMRVAMADLRLDRLFVVFPGSRSFTLDTDLEALALPQLPERLRDL